MDILTQFAELGFTQDEAKIYIELLHEPASHLQLSRATGVDRTKVYRIIESLERRSLVARRTDDRGMFLTAADPTALEVSLMERQQKLTAQKEMTTHLIPTLSALQTKDKSSFVVRNYEGTAGLRQMCWHELKTKGELVAFGNGTIEQLCGDGRWAEDHRDRQVERGYRSRDLINYDYNSDDLPELASERLISTKLYSARKLPYDVITFDSQTVVYNDTVSIYHWKQDHKVGVEIISTTYAQMMRNLFEHFWNIAKEC